MADAASRKASTLIKGTNKRIIAIVKQIKPQQFTVKELFLVPTRHGPDVILLYL